MNDVIWLSQEAHDALQAELQQREGPIAAELSRKIGLAREEGDLRENSGYHAAKDEQGHNVARIRQLKGILENARIGTPESADDEAAHGKVITVRFPALDMEETFLLATREEAAHADIEVYSTTSPLGTAVNGRKVGETIEYTLPNGNAMEVQVLAVADYRPAAS